MHRLLEDIPRGHLHYLAQVHDGDSVTHVLDYAQVVRYEQICKFKLLLQVPHQIQSLCLY